jgi:sugar lactone lactonase YvrE
MCDTTFSQSQWGPAKGCVITLAGTGTKGFKDGPATSAQFSYPDGPAVDASNQVYVADTGNHRIRKISSGQVTTFAGSGSQGFANGPVSSATFYNPVFIIIYSTGTFLVSDFYNNAIRSISGGNVSTFAGTGKSGFTNGPIASATFDRPIGLAMDSSGKVYVADEYNHSIRLISGGQVSTLAGTGNKGYNNGSTTTAQFDHPISVAVDGSGNVYVADSWIHRIRLISGSTVSTFAGTGANGFADGSVTVAKFSYPKGIAIDSKGVLYVADEKNNRIRKISGGTVSTLAGSGATGLADGPVGTAKFYYPSALVIDSHGKLYVTDRFNHCLRLINP